MFYFAKLAVVTTLSIAISTTGATSGTTEGGSNTAANQQQQREITKDENLKHIEGGVVKPEDMYNWLEKYGTPFIDYVCDVGDYLDGEIAKGKSVMFEAQLGARTGAQIIVEPAARNTAAAIALAAHRLPADAIMLVCPSDHHIGDPAAFAAAARAAATLAAEDWLVSFGIEAKSPETDFN